MLTDARQADNPIIYVNKAFERLTGYPAQACLGHNCRFLHRQDRVQRAIEEMRQAIEEQRSIQVLLRNYRQEGRLFWNEVFIAPIYPELFNELVHYYTELLSLRLE